MGDDSPITLARDPKTLMRSLLEVAIRISQGPNAALIVSFVETASSSLRG